jgi:hypothetical protein
LERDAFEGRKDFYSSATSNRWNFRENSGF